MGLWGWSWQVSINPSEFPGAPEQLWKATHLSHAPGKKVQLAGRESKRHGGTFLQDEVLAGVDTSWTSEKSLGSSIEAYLHCLRASQLLYPLDKKAGDP